MMVFLWCNSAGDRARTAKTNSAPLLLGIFIGYTLDTHPFRTVDVLPMEWSDLSKSSHLRIRVCMPMHLPDRFRGHCIIIQACGHSDSYDNAKILQLFSIHSWITTSVHKVTYCYGKCTIRHLSQLLRDVPRDVLLRL